jgi:hypothetical protein
MSLNADPPPIPKQLVFESQWHETDGWKHMHLLYTPETKIFTVTIQHAVVPVDIMIYGRHGKPLGPYELYVGAQLDVCGKATTLQRADPATLQWLDESARFYYKRYLGLVDVVRKFQQPPDCSKYMRRAELALEKRTAGESLNGSVCVANIRKACGVMRRAAVQYRPELALKQGEGSRDADDAE